jgi:ParB family transcriptional regulator, chromosome partitioning protein
VLSGFLAAAKSPTQKKPAEEFKEKFEPYVGKMKVTARQGECRIASKDDFASIPRDRLERAIKVSEDVLNSGNPRVSPL